VGVDEARHRRQSRGIDCLLRVPLEIADGCYIVAFDAYGALVGWLAASIDYRCILDENIKFLCRNITNETIMRQLLF